MLYAKENYSISAYNILNIINENTIKILPF